MKYGCQSMTKKIEKIVLKHPKDAFVSDEHLEMNWKNYGYVEKPDYKKVLQEFAIFESIIHKHVNEILYLPQSNQVGLDSIYTHDSLKITKRGAIYFNTGKMLRQKENLEMERLLQANQIPTLGKINSPGLMEGGDVLWLDDDTVLIGRGYRTNDEGIKQFKELIKGFVKNIIVIPMPHGEGKEACLHLMSIISMINPKLAVVYSKYMPVFMRELLIDRGIELLEVDDKEYDYLGSNVLALDEKKCVMIEGNPKIEAMLTDKGCEVFTYPGHHLSYFGTGGTNMSDMSSLPRLDDRIEEILMSYLKVESFTDTIGETSVDAFFNKTVGNMPYFKNHPTQYGQYEILNDSLNRHVNYAFYKGSDETYVLLHHSDIVNINNYGTFKSLALDPKLLEAAYLNDDSFIDKDARNDLLSGEYLWGRGVADMKGGGAIQLALLEHYSTAKIKPSILLLAVPDEENQSLGMRTAISLLQDLKEDHGLDYKLMINSEPHQRLNEKQGIISQGSIGKLNIFVHVKGVLAHAGKALEGINPNGLLSYIVSRIDLSDDFINETESEMSIPPTWVMMRDNKSCYDISFPSMSYGLLNVLSFTDTPVTILSRLKKICKEAVDDYIEHINLKRRKFSEKTSRNWSDFNKGNYVHTLEEFLSLTNLSRRELINYPEDIERALKATNDGEPMIVIGILPPYYPAVTNKNQDKLIDLVNDFTQTNYQQKYENRMYFTGISDLSYSQLPSKEIEDEMTNILGWEEIYSIPFDAISEVEMPCINIGPWGKDFHKPSERVLKEDLFIRTPQIINYTILNY